MKRPFKIMIEGEIQFLSKDDPAELVKEAVLQDMGHINTRYYPGRYRIVLNERKVDIGKPTKGNL